MSYLGMGIMSGTSMDGLEICVCEFTGDDNNDIWSYRIVKADKYEYTPEWREKLENAHRSSGEELAKLHVDYGHFLGQKVRQFIRSHGLRGVGIQFVACHGHTVFHQPENKFTFQLGDGETIASHTGNALVVTNFRSKDVALGGHGGPLVPAGEQHLFGHYNIFLNLAGTGNIRISGKGFDICPCNMVLNQLAQKYDSSMVFDMEGQTAATGNIITEVLERLNNLPYYTKEPPKSISREWVEKEINPILDTEIYKPEDLLRTFVEHITDQICDTIYEHTKEEAYEPVRIANTMLMTGGGVFNTFLVETLRRKITERGLALCLSDPDHELIKYKEAMIYAFLGLRCLLSMMNVLKDVTGAERDSVCGSIHLPPGGVPISLLATDQYSFSLRKRSSTLGTGSLSLPMVSLSNSPGKLDVKTIFDSEGGGQLTLPNPHAHWPVSSRPRRK